MPNYVNVNRTDLSLVLELAFAGIQDQAEYLNSNYGLTDLGDELKEAQARFELSCAAYDRLVETPDGGDDIRALVEDIATGLTADEHFDQRRFHRSAYEDSDILDEYIVRAREALA